MAAALYTAPGATQISDASQAALALKPVAGENATLLFAFGLFNAALFGAFIIPLSSAFYVAEAFGFESGVNKRLRDAPQFYTLLFLIIALSAGIVLIPHIPLIGLMYWTQVFNGIALPVVLVFMLLLVNNKKLMGSHTNSPLFNIIAWSTVFIMSALSIALVALSLPFV